MRGIEFFIRVIATKFELLPLSVFVSIYFSSPLSGNVFIQLICNQLHLVRYDDVYTGIRLKLQ